MNLRPILIVLLALHGLWAGSPGGVSDIAPFTASDGGQAVFRVAAQNAGSSPTGGGYPRYQWYRNGTAVSGASATQVATMTWRPTVTLTDHGARIFCRVTILGLDGTPTTSDTNTVTLSVVGGPVPVAIASPVAGTTLDVVDPDTGALRYLVVSGTGLGLRWSASHADGTAVSGLSAFDDLQVMRVLLPSRPPVPASVTVTAAGPDGQATATYPLRTPPRPPQFLNTPGTTIPGLSAGNYAGVPVAVPAPGVLFDAYDLNGGPLTASLATAPVQLAGPTLADPGSVAVRADGGFTYTVPAVDLLTLVRITFAIRATDDTGLSATRSVEIVIQPNRLVRLRDDVLEMSAGGAVPVLANDLDLDGDAVHLVDATQPRNGTLVRNGDALTYTPASDAVRSDTFTYRAGDGKGPAATATVTLVRATAGGGGSPDVNGDGVVNQADLAAVVSAFGLAQE
jgi:hypothetical protein